MGCGIKPNSLLNGQQHIKFYQGNAIAVEGPNIVNKLLLENLRVPYGQLLRSRIVLKAGQTNYLLNHLGLGDNATFLGIVATYDGQSVEEDNFVQYYYYSDPSKVYSFGPILILSGNSTNRVEQLYLSNPNLDYPVNLDVLVAIIDDESSFFTGDNAPTVNTSVTFSNLLWEYIVTWVPGETIAILNSADIAQAYINLDDINSFDRQGKIVIIDDRSVGSIYLDFVDEYNAIQAMSVLNWALENPNDSIQDLPGSDDNAPLVTFTTVVTLTNPSLPAAPAPAPAQLTSLDGQTFYAQSVSLSAYGGTLTKAFLLSYLIDSVIDNRDGVITLGSSNIIITDNVDTLYNFIVANGTYIIKLDLSDIAENMVNPDIEIILEVVS
jgi:hypothetical protein